MPGMAVLDRSHRGRLNECSGRTAESAVAARYVARGAKLLAQRWRGAAGEIDLIFEQAGVVVFVEVKSSTTHAAAAASLSARQQLRIMTSAEDFLGTQPAGLLTEMRVDVALVAGGVVEVIEAALGL